MDIKKLEYFVTIVKMGSYSKAAETLFMSQAALSKHIMSLEKELNVILFDRRYRKIAITDAGQILLEHANNVIKSYDTMLEALPRTNDKKLVIASMPIMVQYGITKLLSGFCNQYPEVELSVVELDNDNISFGLRHHDYQLAFMRRDNLDMSKMEVMDIFEDQLVLVMSKQHPMSSRAHLALEQLKNDKFLFLNQDTSLYEYSYNACVKAGFEPNVIFTGTRGENIAELVANNIGVALLMKQVAGCLSNENIVMVPLTEMPNSYISLVRLKRSCYSVSEKIFWNYVNEQQV